METHPCQGLGKLHGIHPTVWGHVRLTPNMYVHLTYFTLKSLSHYPPEQGATVVAERGHLVVVNIELVWDVDAEPLLCDLGIHFVNIVLASAGCNN